MTTRSILKPFNKPEHYHSDNCRPKLRLVVMDPSDRVFHIGKKSPVYIRIYIYIYIHIPTYINIYNMHMVFQRSRPALVQFPSYSSLTGGLIHDADYERGSYFLERGCLTRTVKDMIDSLVLWTSLAVG